MIKTAAPAKINLYLHVVGKLENGYHSIDSLVAFAKVADFISVRENETLKLLNVGPFRDDIGNGEDNLVMKAARYLQNVTGISSGAEIILEKNLPVASGIGGGSSDAAATIRALARLWKIDLSQVGLKNLSTVLGADISICLRGKAGVIRGIGDKVSGIEPLPIMPIVLVNPQAPISTSRVFNSPSIVFSKCIKFGEKSRNFDELICFLMGKSNNDLSHAAIHLVPKIKNILKAFERDPECKLARMSGSGATCFGIFVTRTAADRFAKRVRLVQPNWWVRSTELISNIHAVNF